MPTRRGRLVFLVLTGACSAALPVACRSSSSAPSSSGGAPGFVASDAQDEPTPNAVNCVPPGTPSNANGVGGYCSAGGQECTGSDGAIPLCTADLNGPSNAWFCTIACESDATCGPGGAVCITTMIQGPACVPAACVALIAVGEDGGQGDDAAGDSSAANDASEAGALAEGEGGDE